MRALLTIYFFLFLTTLVAQPTIEVAEVVAEPNDTVVVDVSVKDFTDITYTLFRLNWEAHKVEWLDIIDFHPALVDSILIETHLSQQGILSLAFSNELGATVENGLVFRLVFKVLAEAGTSSFIRIIPPIHVSRLSVGPLNIGLLIQNGAITVVPPNLNIFALPTLTVPGANHCVAIKTTGFAEMIGTQFVIEWDSTILEYTTVQEYGLPGMNITSFGNFQTNQLFVSWFHGALNGESLPNNSTLFQICFDVIGECGETSPIEFPIMANFVEFLNEGQEIEANFIPGYVELCHNTDLVWPGDTDTNKVVNHFDLLPIGLGYGTTGGSRMDATLDWIGQEQSDWANFTPLTGINYKHSDTDGNGEINFWDIIAIAQNWGLTHDFTSNEEDRHILNTSNDATVPFYVFPDSLKENQTYALPLILGTDAIMAESVYGLAFTLNYDPEIIVPNSAKVDFSTSWLGTIDEDMISIQKDFHAAGKLEVAITHIDGINVTGSGTIGHFFLTIEDDILLQSTEETHRNPFLDTRFIIDNVRLIDFQEQTYEVNTKTFDMEIISKTENTILDNKVRVFPNPTSNQLILKTSDIWIEKVELLDVNGVVVLKKQWRQGDEKMGLNGIASGCYALKVFTNEGLVIRKIVVF